ncbi:MAG: rhomboid family intramembrane serine protease [Roseiflexaceae bacterium]|nr:rhomboid family intramembrane serine protease [Roseiflexaceae bacterium]
MTQSEESSQRIALPLYRPLAAWVLLAINIAVFIIPEVLGLTSVVQALGAKNNAAIVSGDYYRFLTAMFLHAGLTHIGFNAFALYSLGPDVERFYGTPRFLAIYFLAGFGGGIASYTLSPNDSVGASGAIFGLIGALGAFFYQTRKIFGEVSRQQIGNLIFITMINLGIGFTTPRIDNFAHIGGLLCGIIAGLLLAPNLAVDLQQIPPTIVRRARSYGWPGAVALLLALIAMVMVIQPPLR